MNKGVTVVDDTGMDGDFTWHAKLPTTEDIYATRYGVRVIQRCAAQAWSRFARVRDA
jgi:hypothetical protein